MAQLWRRFPLAMRRARVPEGKYGEGSGRRESQVKEPPRARSSQVWFGRTGPWATSVRSRSAWCGWAAPWREPLEAGRHGVRL